MPGRTKKKFSSYDHRPEWLRSGASVVAFHAHPETTTAILTTVSTVDEESRTFHVTDMQETFDLDTGTAGANWPSTVGIAKAGSEDAETWLGIAAFNKGKIEVRRALDEWRWNKVTDQRATEDVADALVQLVASPDPRYAEAATADRRPPVARVDRLPTASTINSWLRDGAEVTTFNWAERGRGSREAPFSVIDSTVSLQPGAEKFVVRGFGGWDDVTFDPATLKNGNGTHVVPARSAKGRYFRALRLAGKLAAEEPGTIVLEHPKSTRGLAEAFVDLVEAGKQITR